MDFPELHDESIPAVNLFIQVSKLLRASGVRDFSMRDLTKPDPVRLRKFLSAVINLAKYREEKLVAYTSLQDRHEELIDERDRLKVENAELERELKRLQDERDAELPEVANVEADVDIVFAENQSLNKQQAALSNQVKALKDEVTTVTDESSELKLMVNTAKATQQDLLSQIVTSPHKIRAVLDDLAGAVQMEQALSQEAEKRARDLATKLDAALKIEKELARVISTMHETDAEIKKKKDVSKRVKALRAKLTAQEHDITQLEATHQHLGRQHASLVERIDRVKAQCDIRKQAAQGRVEEQLRHREAIEAGNAAAVAKLNQNAARIRAIEAQMLELRESHEGQIASVLNQYYGLLQAVEGYHQRIDETIVSCQDSMVSGKGGDSTTTSTHSITQSLQQLMVRGHSPSLG